MPATSPGGSGVPRPPALLLMGYKCGDSHDHLQWCNLLEQPRELRKVLNLTITVLLYRLHIGWGPEGPEHRASLLSPHGTKVCHSPAHLCAHRMGNCPEVHGPDFLLGFCHMGITDEIIGHVTEHSFQTSLCSLEVGGWAEIPNSLVKWSVILVTNPHPETI